MKVIDFNIKRYDLPLVKPLTINSNTIYHRSGVIIFLTDDAGFVGCGETASLPGLHKESLDEAILQLKSLKEKILSLQVHPSLFDFNGRLKKIFSEDLFPSVRLGIEMALFNLFRQVDNTFINSKTTTVNINGLVMPGDDLLAEVYSLLKQGYSTIKIKVGRKSIDEDIKTVLTLKEIIKGKAVLRLDANRSWPLAEAIAFCRQVGPAAIEYIEEPLENIADLAAFFKETAMPVALDETIAVQRVDSMKELNGIDAFVLKPAVLGGFDRTAGFVRFAKKNHKKACLSSEFQTSLTLEAFVAFAAKIGITDTTHGLDTGRWLAEDLFVNPLAISKGAIKISLLPPSPVNLRMDLLKDIY